MALFFNSIKAAFSQLSVAADSNFPGSYSVSDKKLYDPSPRDVIIVRYLLHVIASFPLELIDTIIDLAEYWPCVSTINTTNHKVRSSQNDGNKFVLRSVPLGVVPDHYNGSGGIENPYYLTPPRPWRDPTEASKDMSHQVVSRLRSKFHTRGEHPCRKIVFTIKSHDQGWASDRSDTGTYTGSYTWFDVGLEKMIPINEKTSDEAPFPPFCITKSGPEFPTDPDAGNSDPIRDIYTLRTILPHTTVTQHTDSQDMSYQFEHPLLPDDTVLQKNVKCSKRMKEHVIVWSFDDRTEPQSEEANELEEQGKGRVTGSGDMVRGLVVGDVVTLWAKSRFPGWVNEIEEVKIDVYWAV